MSVRGFLMRGVSIAAAIVLCAALAQRLGPLKAVILWACAVGAVDVVTATLIHRQSPPEKVSWINHLAGFVLPWGYRIGRGKLWPIVLTSWLIWMLIGVAVMTAVATNRYDEVAGVATINGRTQRNPVVTGLLVVAWLVDGGVLLRCIGLLATSPNRRQILRSLSVPMAILAGILLASIGLVTVNCTPAAARTALLIAGGPPLLIAVAYGGFVLVMLTAGRHARWN